MFSSLLRRSKSQLQTQPSSKNLTLPQLQFFRERSSITPPPPKPLEERAPDGVPLPNHLRKSKIGRLPLISVCQWPLDTRLPTNAHTVLAKSPSVFYRPLFVTTARPVSVNFIFELALPDTLAPTLDDIAARVIEKIESESGERYCFFLVSGNYINCAQLRRSVSQIFADRLESTDSCKLIADTFNVTLQSLRASPALVELLTERYVSTNVSNIFARLLIAVDGNYNALHVRNTDGVVALNEALTRVIERDALARDHYLPRSLYGSKKNATPSVPAPVLTANIIQPWLSQLTPAATKIRDTSIVYLLPLPVVAGALAFAATPPVRLACLQNLPAPNSIRPAFNVFAPTRQDYVDAFAVRMREWAQERLERHTRLAQSQDATLRLRMLDMGCGTGVLSLVAARLFEEQTTRLGMKHATLDITAVDINPRAVNCTSLNLASIPNVAVGLSDVFAQVADVDRNNCRDTSGLRKDAGKYDLIVFNPPWLALSPRTNTSLDAAVYDANHHILKRFLNEVAEHTRPGATIYVLVSDLGERMGLDPPGTMRALVESAPGLTYLGMHTAPTYRDTFAGAGALGRVRAEENLLVFALRAMNAPARRAPHQTGK